VRKTKIVVLGQVRDVLAEWERARSAFLTGKYKGFYLHLQNEEGGDTVFVGGVHKEDSYAATKAMLKVSAARALTEDEPPPLKVSQV
jgi:hypothetical protein